MNRLTKTPPLILASDSPRRRQLLAETGLEFEAVSPPIEELKNGLRTLMPAEKAEALAYFKARAVAQSHEGCYVLGADTVVAAGDEILGKPADADDARRMLRMLSGTRHAVITGVALLGPCHERLIASETTYLTMRPMTDQQIADYVESGQWQGKAGAYAIQDTADRFIEKVEGNFDNVVGLPVQLVQRMIRELRQHPETHKAS